MQTILSKLNLLYLKISGIITPVIVIIVSETKLFYAPVSSLFFPLFLLTLADVITGIWASRKEGIPFSSKRFFYNKGIIIVLFFICLTAILALDIFLKLYADSIPGWLAKTWMTFCAVYELISIFENASRIKNIPIFASFLTFFKKHFKEKTGIDTDNKK